VLDGRVAEPKWAWAGLVLIIALAALIRHHHFATVHSWFDESLGWRMAQFPPGEIVDRSERNVHPPAHFLLLSAWSGVFGGSLASLRYYSLLWGLGTVVGGYFLTAAAMASRDVRRRAFAGLLASLLIALSSLHIQWSQQIKMYALGTCLTVWSTWLLLRWFQSGGAFRLVGYVPLAVALALQHHYGTFTVFAQLTFALLWSARRSWTKTRPGDFTSIVITGWATASLWSLWLPSFLVQRALVKESYWIDQFQWQNVPKVWSELFTAYTSLRPSQDVSLGITQVVLTSIVVLLALRMPGARMLGWLVLVPFTIAVSWSLWDRNVLVPRYLINAHVCLLCGLALLAATIPVAFLRYVLAIALVLGVALTGYEQRLRRTRHAETPGMPAVVSALGEAKNAGEPVLVCNPMLYLNVCAHQLNLPDVYAFDPGYSFPHFQGTPVMRDEEYLSLTELNEAGHDWAWALDAEKWLGGNWKVHLPPEWELQEERRIEEWYATLVIRAYRRESSPARGSDRLTERAM
jgi:uncharacterized membrane protein